MVAPVVLFTDFGLAGPYLGQMKHAVLRREPGIPLVDLFDDLPPWQPQLAAYLLAAYAGEFAPGSVFLTVVDPGVGTSRRPVAVEADGRWFVGPENGLFALVARRAQRARWWPITWRPERLSASFHGRDLFAPVAARLSRGDRPAAQGASATTLDRPEWPDDLAQVVYVDGYGNAMTGMRASTLAEGTVLTVGRRKLPRYTTFADAKPGEPFWYENANGLAEIAVNRGNAADLLQLSPGDEIGVAVAAKRVRRREPQRGGRSAAGSRASSSRK